MKFTVLREDREPAKVRINLPGRHNVLNALGAIAVADLLEVPDRGDF